jgi:hypothetical protein
MCIMTMGVWVAFQAHPIHDCLVLVGRLIESCLALYTPAGLWGSGAFRSWFARPTEEWVRTMFNYHSIAEKVAIENYIFNR